MNKKARIILKTSAVIMFLLIFIILILSILPVTAILDKQHYELGEKVKIDLREIENYTLKINTPSTSYLKKGNNDVLLFQPEEIGHYSLTLNYNYKQERFEFEVIEKKEGETTGILEKDSKKKIGEDLSKEIIDEDNQTNLTKKNTILKETNQSLLDKTNKSGEETNNTEEKIIINKPVKWNIKENIPEGSKKVRVKIPVNAENISVYKHEYDTKKRIDAEIDNNLIRNVGTRIFSLNENPGNAYITLEDVDGEIEVEYLTPPATAQEKIISEKKKEVVVSSPSNLHYENVTSYTNLPVEVSSKDLIKIYWKEENIYLNFEAFDTNQNGLLDYIEWIVPHLSEQTFEIIIITKAEHLDENKNFIEDIYGEVKELDGIWSSAVNNNEYVRVTFEKLLNKKSDITIYPRVVSGNPKVEVYEMNGNERIAEFSNLNPNEYNKIYLTNLQGEQDSFDLKVIGGSIEFDHIIDPILNWWNNSWYARKTINITSVGALTNFPAYLNVSKESEMQSDYDDLRFFNGSCTSGNTLALDYEIENYTSTNAHLWIKIPSLVSGVNQICMYYSNDDASSGENATGVWDVNYIAVYHMSENPTGTVFDSTSNRYHLTSGGTMASDDLIAGPIGNAIDFDGINDVLTNTSFDWASSGPATLEFWNYVATADVKDSGVAGFSVNGSERFSNHFPWGNGNAYWDYGTCCDAGRVFGGYSAYYNTWAYTASRSQGLGGSAQNILVNMNTLASKTSSDGPTAVLQDFRIGNFNGASYFKGRVDEVRVSNVYRSNDWINQTYQMMANQNSFVSFGSEEKGYGVLSLTLVNPNQNKNVVQNQFFNFTVNVSCNQGQCGNVNVTLDPISSDWWNTSWMKRKEINISSSADLSDFPIYLNISKETEMQNDFDDLRFINGSCSSEETLELDYEIENYTSSNAHVWLKIPNLNSGITSICMYYNNSDALNGEDVTRVWSNNYINVQHFQETSGTHVDSSGHKNGTNYGTNQDAMGYIDGANDFQDNDYVRLSSFNGLNGKQETSISYWAKQDSSTTQDYTLWANLQILIEHGASFGSPQGAANLRVRWHLEGDWRTAHIAPSVLDTGNWHYWTFDKNSSGTTKIYKDGVEVYTGTDTQTNFSTNSPDFDIGYRSGSGGFDGIIDEFTISNNSRSQGWVNMSYQLMKNPSSIVSFGDEEDQTYVKGVVSMTSGALPFYTISKNPIDYINNSCLGDMNDGDSCLITWSVNATGALGSTHEFYAYAESLNYSGNISNANSSKINLTIYAGEQATANEIQCEQGGGWKACSEIDYGEIITRVRANCTYSEGDIVNATFNLTGIADKYNYFYGSVLVGDGDWWVYDNNPNVQIQDSGEFRLEVVCFDENGKSDSNYSNWTVDWGVLNVTLITPIEDRNIAQYRFFDFNVSVSCLGGECGYVNVSLDPPEGYTVVVFNETGDTNWTVPAGVSEVQVLVVAGGGAAGSHVTYGGTGTGSGGGGAGGLIYDDSYSVTPGQVIDISVGTGGISPATQGQGGDGTNSSFGTLNARGGGGGGNRNTAGRSGGSGGGGGYASAGGSGTVGQGNQGGTGTNDFGGSGGGGASQAGEDGNGDAGRYGGNGTNYSDIFGSEYGEEGYFAGGGGGGGRDGNSGGTGGLGGGGDGGSNSDGISAINGTGGGGGGSGDAGWRGGHGGSGIVLIRYSVEKTGFVPYGDGFPFYTINQNPRDYLNLSCLANMKDGDSCNISWRVNATGLIETTTEFYAIASSVNYSSYFPDVESKHINLTIAENLDVSVENIQCEEGGSWKACSEVDFGENITRVRADCISQDGTVLNATFNLTNLDDSINYFYANATSNISNSWIYDNSDLEINESGEYILEVTCFDDVPTTDTESVEWDVDYGTLSVTLINPSSNANVNPNEFFSFTARINCLGGECGDVNATLDPVNWWNTGFIYRKNVNITSSAALSDFPVYLNVNYASGMQSDYDDLRFVSGSCEAGVANELSYEIESYDSNNAHVWLKIPSLTTGTNSICMYYGNDDAQSGQNVSDVWSNNYVMVNHMNNYNSTYLVDSAGNYNGTKRSSTQPTEISGPVGNAQDFNGDSWILTALSWDGGPVTFEFWNYVAQAETQQSNVFAASVDRMNSHSPWSDNNVYFDYGAGCCSYRISTSYSSYYDDWTYVTYTSEATTSVNKMEIFFNGISATSNNNGGEVSGISSFRIGSNSAGSGSYHPGSLDEFRMSSVVRSADWINMSYQIMKNQDNLVSFGSEEQNTDKGGIISMIAGTKPFYTTTLNPNDYTNTSCLQDMRNENCEVTWHVNATGPIGSTWEFFVDANSTTLANSSATSNRINITIGNAPPLTPELNLPANGSALSVIGELNWSNSIDPTGDDVYYVLEVSNVSDFSEIVYYNGSISERETITGDTPSGITQEGAYYWRVLATDLKGNSSWSEEWIFYYDLTPPNITLISPENDTTNTTTNTQTFSYNVTDLTEIMNCTLILNGELNETDDSVTRGNIETITSTIPNGIYDWSINCTDKAGFTGASETRVLNLTVADNPPSAHEIECEKDSSGSFISCSNLVFGDNLTRIRVRCTDPENNLSSAIFNLTNIPDNYNYLYNSTNVSSGSYYILENLSKMINDSGNFSLIATCVDSEALTGTNSTIWLVPWGTPTINLVNPNTNSYVMQNQFFDFNISIGCSGGECGDVNATLDPIGWWDNKWGRRKTINITSVGSLTDFPAYLNVSKETEMQNDFDDLRFFNGSCLSGETQELDYEIENYTSNNAHVWIRIPSLVSGTNQICMYYANDDAENGENVSGVWSNGYVMVHHMQDETTTTLSDSAGIYNGTKRSSTQPSEIAGVIGKAHDFNGDSYVDISMNWGGGPVTFEFWNYVASAETQNSNVFSYNTERMDSHAPWGNNNIYFDYGPNCCSDDRISTSYASYYDSWTHVTFTSEGVNGGRMEIFFNGNSATSNNAGGQITSGSLFKLGVKGTNYHPGSVDEFRMSNVVRSNDWINQTYQMVANQNSFVSFGSEEKGKSGAISMVVGDTPFYTISQNPRDHINTTCLANMKPGDSCDVSWIVNATGEINSVWEFFVIANTTNYTEWFSSGNESSRINITIVNQLAPTVPQLYLPLNRTTSSSVVEFNWTNSTDVNGDAIYYILQVSNVSNFSDIVYYNGSIPEQESPTGDTPVLPSENTYYWRVLATDLIDNSSWSETRVFYYSSSPPNLTFVNQTGEDNLIINENHPLDQGENLTINVKVDSENVDSVWVVVWEGVKGGVEKVKIFFTYVAGILWKATIPTDYAWNLLNYNYTIYANDTAGRTAEYDGNFTLLKGSITLGLTPNPVSSVTNVTAYGFLNLTNGSALANYPLNIWIDDALLLFSNVTPEGTYDNYLEFIDTSDTQFNKGTYANTITDGENLKLASGNYSGNFTRILDAGARVEWNNVSWGFTGQACSAVVDFQEGDVRGYSQTQDTYISSGSATTNFGSSESIIVDGSPTIERGLIKFDNIFGTNRNQIPYNSTISGANITFVVFDIGNIVNVYEVLENWTESEASYNNRLTGTAWGSAGCGGSPSRSLTAEDDFTASSTGVYSVDIINAMKRWVNGTSENYGVVFDMSSSNGVWLRSSEYSTQGERPKLNVQYTSDDCTGVDVYVRTSNDKSSWTDWQKISNSESINDPNTASRYLEYRVELSTTNNSFTPIVSEVVVNYTAIVTNSSGYYRYNFTNPSSYGTYEIKVETGLRTIIINNSETLFVETGVGPNVYLISPEDELWFPYGNLTLVYNVTDINDDIANSTLIINGQLNETNSSAIINGHYNNFTINFTSGQYNWTVNVTDSTGLVGTDNQRIFYIDLENPNITLIFPENGSSYSDNVLNFSFNATDNLAPVLTCDVYLGEDAVHEDVSANNGEIINLSTGTLTSGDYTWYVVCVDEVERSFMSDIWEFSINDTAPEVELIWPEQDYIDDDGNISFVFNATDNTGFINCSLLINDSFYATNQTPINNGGNTTINVTGLGEGYHNWTVECFDLSESSHKPDSRDFVVDLFPPLIELNAPENYDNLSYADVTFNFTANDTIDSLLDCNIRIDNVIRDTFTANSGILTNVLVSNLIDGERVWYITCWDDAGHSNSSSVWRVNISEPPTVVLNTPNETSFNETTIELFYTPYDNTNLSSCDLYIDGAYNQTNATEIINGEENNFTVVGISGGEHSWFVNCTDLIGLTAQSEERVFFIDTIGPNITLYYPDGHEIGTDDIFFNFTVVDDIDFSVVCDLIVDTSIVNESFTAYNGSVTNITQSGITDGFHTWHVNCTDSTNNAGGSEIFNFTKSTPPDVSLVSPDDGHWFNISSFYLYYLPFDDEGFLESALFINGALNQTNSSKVTSNENNNFSITNFPDGLYNWTIRATDVSGLNTTASPNRTFYVDTQSPGLVLNFPNQSANLSTNNVTLNFTVFDNLDPEIECNLFLDGEIEYSGNSSNGTDVINYALVGDGVHYWNVTCIDEAGNYNYSETITFSVEAPPNVTLISPNNSEYINTSSTVFVYLPEDPIGFENCSLYIDGIFNDSVGSASITANEQNNFTVSNIPEGYHNWTVECIDAAPDYNPFSPTPWNFTMDRTPPSITLNHPVNNLNTLRSLEFNFTANDTLDGDGNLTCNLYIDGNPNITGIIAQNNADQLNTVSGLSLGSHTWNVSCIDDAFNLGWSETWNFNVTLADLMVNSSSIEFNNTNPTENEIVMINATIFNLINVSVKNITVQFFDGNPEIEGVQIGENQTIDLINPLSQEITSVNWNADLGTSEIFVIIDPPLASNGSIEEWNENNNEANKSITTGSWGFIVGKIDLGSQYSLADSGDSYLTNWSAANFETGNIYAADTESSISWTSLQAIGKTSDGLDSTNDFAEIDDLLEMTGFFDSVENLYTNSSGDAINKTSYIIFGSSIDEVPITNSTNNTNFQTGILWDTSDSSDTEYNQTDKEDLVFVSALNKNKVGAYGTYDYEIRVPAKLREYRTSETNAVQLFVELK